MDNSSDSAESDDLDVEARFKDHLRLLHEGSLSSIQSYDKALLSMAAGGLGVILYKALDSTGSAPIVDSKFLVLAAVFWAASILSTIGSFLYSHHLHERSIKAVHASIENGDHQPYDDYIAKQGKRSRWILFVVNAISGILLVIGAIFLILFLGANLP